MTTPVLKPSVAHSGRARDIAAQRADVAAHRRDEEADARDELADDQAIATRLPTDVDKDDAPDVLRELELLAVAEREHASLDRALAATARAEAAVDRARASQDREIAARDRADAHRERELAATDELTGARRRGAGLAAIQAEIDRARRTDGQLVAVFVDVDGLKETNDSRGHAAGDGLLVAVTDALRQCLRSYDLITRLAGDEFVCLLGGIDVVGARRRLTAAAAYLYVAEPGATISAGFADLKGEESADDLIARAEADFAHGRGYRRVTGTEGRRRSTGGEPG